jgi:hypothetical protein
MAQVSGDLKIVPWGEIVSKRFGLVLVNLKKEEKAVS